ncbi:hypothetical protein P1X15_12310 [Runella sp. MFBS21]|uniref:hypothetical protein n=1 Tax=Runella sp. MFBS21 TaxID=3034018 RepID=UPI0023F898B6|nr:hypothetical protein [Runella sp. MFBS21]MDF7818388.1 hypothetical protein [Runella sp. MFBS21]
MMKTLLGVLMLFFVVVFISRDTHAFKKTNPFPPYNCQEMHHWCSMSAKNGKDLVVAVKEIPPVGCAIPMPILSAYAK